MLVGRDLELGVLHAHLENMLAGKGSVLFLTGEAGLGKTTLVHSWISQLTGIADFGLRNADLKTDNHVDAIDSRENEQSAIRNPKSAIFLESACSIPIGNVDVGSLEALQPWADVIAGISDFESLQSSDLGHRISDKSESQQSVPTSEIRNPKSSKSSLDLKKLIHDSAPAWAWALPVVGDIAHAAVETVRAAQEQRSDGGKVNMKKLAQETASTWAMALPVVGGLAHAAVETARLAKEQKTKAATPSAMNQQQVFQQYVNLLTKVSEEQPLIIFLDDLHWADPSSCNLLFYLSRQISEKKILVIGTYRQEDVLLANDGKGHPIVTVKNEMQRYGVVNELKLGYLTKDAIHQILQQTFSSYTTDEILESWLLKISDGNALFVTQFLKTLREDGHLDSEGNFGGSYETITIPDSALAVVEERARRLDDSTREVLMYATAEGEEFTTYVLEQLTEKKSMELFKDLRTATKQGLIVERGKSKLFANRTTALFGFSHMLFHKALYDQLFDAQKEHLHHQCFEILKAEWDSTNVSQEQTTLASKLLVHAEKCEEWGSVADIALEAARRAWENYAAEEALSMIIKVLAAVDHGGDEFNRQRARALQMRGAIRLRTGQNAEALQDTMLAETLFRRAGDVNGAAGTVSNLATVYNNMRQFETSLSEAHRGLLEATEIGNENLKAKMYNAIGLAERDLFRYDDALASFEQCRAQWQSLNDLAGQAAAYINIGTVYGHRGEYSREVEVLMQALPLARDAGQIMWERNALGNLSDANLHLGNFEQTNIYNIQSLELNKKIGDRYSEWTTINRFGLMHQGMGDFEEAIARYSEAIEIARLYFPPGVAGSMINKAEVLLFLDRPEEARRVCLEGLELVRTVNHKEWEANALAVMGMTYCAEKRYEDALPWIEESIAIFQTITFPPGEAVERIDHVFCCIKLGRLDDAREGLHLCEPLIPKMEKSSMFREKLDCLHAMLADAEAMQRAGDERIAKLSEALQMMQRAVEALRIGDSNMARWDEELRRMKTGV